MTYREKIQQMIETLQKIYDEANELRDQGDEHEKMYLNKVKEIIPLVWTPLQRLDNYISDSKASMKI